MFQNIESLKTDIDNVFAAMTEQRAVFTELLRFAIGWKGDGCICRQGCEAQQETSRKYREVLKALHISEEQIEVARQQLGVGTRDTREGRTFLFAMKGADWCIEFDHLMNLLFFLLEIQKKNPNRIRI